MFVCTDVTGHAQATSKLPRSQRDAEMLKFPRSITWVQTWGEEKPLSKIQTVLCFSVFYFHKLIPLPKRVKTTGFFIAPSGYRKYPQQIMKTREESVIYHSKGRFNSKPLILPAQLIEKKKKQNKTKKTREKERRGEKRKAKMQKEPSK